MPTDDHKSELLARWDATLPQQHELGEPEAIALGAVVLAEFGERFRDISLED